jgi:PAS domain S-box-containing protein
MVMSIKILIADDEKAVRDLLAKTLKAEGLVTLEAVNGAEAVDLIRHNSVDLAILDVSMPVMNGIRAGREIHRIAPEVGILMITGHLDIDPMMRVFSENVVSDYIFKPLDLSVVTNAIRIALAKNEMRRFASPMIKDLQERIHSLERDETERILKLRASQLQYKNIVEGSRDMILVCRDGNICYANPRTVTLSGYSAGELIELSLGDIIHPDDQIRIMPLFRQGSTSKKADALPLFRMLRKDRKCFWVEMCLAPNIWDGKPARLAVLRDVSERMDAEARLKIKDRAIAASGNGFFFADRRGNITDINRSFLKLLAYERESEVRGRHLQDFFQLRHRGEETRLLKTILSSGHGTFEVKGWRKDGTERDFQVSISLVKNEKDTLLCIMGSFADITEQKQIGELMVRSEKLNSLGQLAAGLAHELKNPLAVISSCAQFCLSEKKIDRSLQENLQVIFRNSRRANRLIVELLNFAKPSRLSVKDVDINELLSSAAKMASFEIQGFKTVFIMDLQAGLPEISADEDKLKQVFLNVILNALQAIGGKGTLTIRTTLDVSRHGIQVDIVDDGPGIPPDYRQRIFDPFFSTKDGGTGLGLSICHSIVKEHGGEILTACPEGGGTCISIRLPRAVPGANAAKQGYGTRGHNGDKNPSGGR